jgi:hypothetical protein
MNHNLEIKVQAWLDGELSATDAWHISQEIAGDAEASRLAIELQSVKSALAGHERAMTVPETREFYWSKIERQIRPQARSARPAQARPALLRWFPSLAGFVALACLMVLSVKPHAPAPSAADEISSSDNGMEAVTFHDQSTGMTVIWLGGDEQAQPAQLPAAKTPAPDDSEPELD